MTKIVTSNMLRCGLCFELKNIETDNFGTSKTSKSGYRSYCRSCENLASKKSKGKAKAEREQMFTLQELLDYATTEKLTGKTVKGFLTDLIAKTGTKEL